MCEGSASAACLVRSWLSAGCWCLKLQADFLLVLLGVGVLMPLTWVPVPVERCTLSDLSCRSPRQNHAKSWAMRTTVSSSLF